MLSSKSHNQAIPTYSKFVKTFTLYYQNTLNPLHTNTPLENHHKLSYLLFYNSINLTLKVTLTPYISIFTSILY